MKKITTFIACFLLLFAPKSHAQLISVEYDTVSSTPPLNISSTVEDGVSSTTGTVTIVWNVLASDFPADWVSSAFSICDNSTCYLGTGLWSTTSGSLSTHTSMPYATGTGHSPGGDFHLLMDFSSANSTGTHYMIVKMKNQATPSDSVTETYIITNNGTTGISSITGSSDDVLIYPNPTHDEINVVYDPASDVKSISVYNVIGKVMAVYKVSDNNSANLQLENMPSGFYFVRLFNSHGDLVTTRKFTKQ